MAADPQPTPKARCCCCSLLLLTVAASMVFLPAHFMHLTPIAVLGTLKSWIVRTAEQKVMHLGENESPPPIPQSAIPPGSDLLPPPAARAESAVQPMHAPQSAPAAPTARTVNYLEPFDPSLQPEECRLDGLLTDPIIIDANHIQMRVLWETQPGQRRAVLSAPRTESVDFDSTTLVTKSHSPSAISSLGELSGEPMHITAIGVNAGLGTSLKARSIDIEPSTAIETALSDDMQDAADAIVDQPHRPAVVTLQRQPVAIDGSVKIIQFVRAAGGTFHIAVGIAHGKVGATDTLDAIARHYHAIAAINGSFFDCYAPGPIKMPDHALISNGRLISRGGVGTMIGETPDGRIRFDRAYDASRWHEYDPIRPSPQILQDPQYSVLFWAHSTEALGCGPKLVTDGEESLSPAQEGFSSSEVLTGISVRSAVGITKDGSIILIVTHASLDQLAKTMLQLGCREAMNLDGGASSGLWIKGQSIRTPGRLLSNALLIVPR